MSTVIGVNYGTSHENSDEEIKSNLGVEMLGLRLSHNSSRSRRRGFTLIELVLALGIMSAALVGIASAIAENQQTVRDIATAKHMRVVMDAARSYISANAGTIVANTTINMNTLRTQGFLPAGIQDTNPFGQTYRLLIRPVTVAGRPFIDGLVITTGGRPIELSRLPRVAAVIGADGGFVSNIAPYNAANITGVFGGWSSTIATWNFGGAGNTPAVGYLAGTISFNSFQINDYLYRVAVPGLPELNRMSTNLDMGANDINNAQNVNVNNNITVGGDILLTAATGDITMAGGTISGPSQINMQTAGGDIRFVNDVFLNRGGPNNKRLSNAIMDVSILASGSTMTKPVCPSGTTAQVSVAPIMVNDNGTGRPLRGFQTFAVDTGATWTIRLNVAVENTTTGGLEILEPTAAFGRILALARCV
jgi:prepilin-type N-terminal cleavage/methylation domain-containing protein